MSSRTQNDTVIDDDEEQCPLCIEEFDLSDKNFKPCPCGYQICQFCYNNIKTHSEEGRCPNCRRVYDESTIQYRVPDVDEFKADLALKHRKAAAAKRKEAEKREIEASSRKNLAGVRVVQKNLVYVIGLNPTIRDENQLLQTLRGEQYFGQYGDIDKIVVSKAKPGGNPNQGIGVYVTFARKSDAASCIAAVDGSPNGDRVLRAQYGTTKYCSSFLRNEQCNNRNCTFLHETGNDSDSFSRQDLSSMNSISSQRFNSNGPPVTSNMQQSINQRPVGPTNQTAPSVTQPLRWQSGKEDGAGSRGGSMDSSALPSSASWANKDSLVHRTRRESTAGSRSSPSPKPPTESPSSRPESNVTKTQELPKPAEASSSSATTTKAVDQSRAPTRPISPSHAKSLNQLLKAVNSPDFRFQFSSSALSQDEQALIENHPSLIDPYGGVKRRAMRERLDQERARHGSDARVPLQSNSMDDENLNLESGSSQLGGEPDELHMAAGLTGRHVREPQLAIQPPSHQATTNNSAGGSPASAAHHFPGINTNGRNLSQLQQQQLMLLKSAGGQHPNFMELQLNNAGNFDHNALARGGTFQNQLPGMGNMPGHARQSSRFSFAGDINAKGSNPRLLGQQAPMIQNSNSNPLSTPANQHSLSNQYSVSGVQGPPPGLKTAGTPPVSGGGMFAQGHGFTSTMNNNLGVGTKQDGNADLMRELMRARNSANAAVHSHDTTKREFIFPFLQQNTTPPPLAPVSGLFNPLYGQPLGSYQDSVPQKQKKRGKKQRHANTSSGGGGVVDLVDPNVLQARMHQSGANASPGQGLYGSQGQEEEDFPPLAPASKPNYDKPSLEAIRFPMRTTVTNEHVSRSRTGTPTIPPGFSLSHAHPSASIASGSHSSSPTLAKIPLPPGLGRPMPINNSPQQDSSASSPKARQNDRASEVSFGSPKPKASTKTKTGVQQNHMPGSDIKDQSSHPKSKPLKLDLSMVDKDHDSASQASSPNRIVSAPASRPNTPGNYNIRASDSPAPRLPRVLRVVDTPKPDAPQTHKEINSNVKHRPNIHGGPPTSRPATPAEVSSEYDPHTSASASRASSPPPSRIGSAPIRTVTKNQLKKDRKLKAKEEANKEESGPTNPNADDQVQAPIIGRKRKTKKPTKLNDDTEPSTPDGEDKSVVEKEPSKEQPESSKAPPPRSTPAKVIESQEEIPKPEPVKQEDDEPWRNHNTLKQLSHDANTKGIPIKDLFLDRTAPLPVLLGQLHQLNDLDLTVHPLFNSPNLALRTDMKCTAADYDSFKRPLELTEEYRKKLLRGEPVRINPDSDKLKERVLISPSGCILRHLSAAEEDRFLELEESLASIMQVIQPFYPSVMVTEPNVTNRGGGLDALFATPEKFNIRWVSDEAARAKVAGTNPDGSAILSPPSGSQASTMPTSEAELVRSQNWPMTAAASETIHVSGPIRSPVRSLLGTRRGMGVDIDRLVSVPGPELRSMVEHAQRELEVSRKAAEAIDKKVMGLVKRNKKLVQQALMTALDSVG
ncbi:transcriptional repressor general negative regulator of transcription subunit 4 [Myotisia sp. PD_48]|nr:transcriptional repressor general negative regulator of transcription subunit 4 [Myotisia sp. PD_48]